MGNFVFVTSKYIVNVDLVSYIVRSENGGLLLNTASTSNKDGNSHTLMIGPEDATAFLQRIKVSGKHSQEA